MLIFRMRACTRISARQYFASWLEASLFKEEPRYFSYIIFATSAGAYTLLEIRYLVMPANSEL